MTEEEARAEREEAERLKSEIHRLHARIDSALAEKVRLEAELEALIQSIQALNHDAKSMDHEVNKVLEYLQNYLKSVDVDTSDVYMAINEMTTSYFTFKNLSTATKNVTQYTDEYYTKFKFYQELRRITLGYVIGLDAHVCSDETMRKTVEEVYLKNTDYWLAYAIMGVMLWASDEEEAAKRAVGKAISMDYMSTSIFFLLINLRFTRVDAAKKWFLSYLDRIDIENLGNEWQYLLQAYLFGVFGVDKTFHQLVQEHFVSMLTQMETLHPDYGNQVAEKTASYSDAYIHITDNEFVYLRRYCTEYSEMKELLSAAEKNSVLTMHFREVLEADIKNEENIFQRSEDILYRLINEYDKEESKVIKKKRYNEMIIKAKGNLGAAEQFYQMEYPKELKPRTLSDQLFTWAFDEEGRVDIGVKRFAISYLKKWIKKGFLQFGENYRKREKAKYKITIDGWSKDCDEDSYDTAKNELAEYYNKDRFINTIKDKFVMIFSGMVVAAIVVLLITMFKFNKVSLVIGILLGVIGGFLLWRRVVDVQTILRAKRERGLGLLKKVLVEMKSWRELYHSEDSKHTDLAEVFDSMEI